MERTLAEIAGSSPGCGVSGCSKLNVHSKCHGIKLINGQQKSVTDFCKLYVRYGFGINIESGKKSYFVEGAKDIFRK